MADQSVTEKNRAHFDAAASTYDSRYSSTIDELISEIRARLPFFGIDFLDSSSSSEDETPATTSSSTAKAKSSTPQKTIRLLDYACGTGLITRALSPYITSSTGIDLSPNMVQQYNLLANQQGLSSSEMHAYEGNLLRKEDGGRPKEFEGKEFWDFDLAVVGLGFHHFEEPEEAARRLGERLKKGGVLLIVDFVTHGWGEEEGLGRGEHGHGHGHGDDEAHSHSHEHSHDDHHHHDGRGKNPAPDSAEAHQSHIEKARATVQHHGFSESEIKAAFIAAGLGKDFGYEVVERQIVFRMPQKTMKRRIFLARGSKE